MDKYYIAYGSNLNVTQMRVRCPGAKIAGTATLQDWRLVFRGGIIGSYLTIEPEKGSSVPVAIWRVSDRNEQALDWYEGFPRLYYKENFTVDCKDKKAGTTTQLTAFAYIMSPGRTIGEPTAGYMRTCLEGYDMFSFDKQILLDAYGRCMEGIRNEK